MIRAFTLFCGLLLVGLVAAGSAPQKAFVWPLPRTLSTGNNVTGVLTARGFTFTTDSSTKITDLLRKAFDRHFSYCFENKAITVEVDYPALELPPATTVTVPGLTVSVKNPDETLVLGTDESYVLTIPDDGTTATLAAETSYGVLRGLESFTQLVQWTGTQFIIPHLPIKINDAPRFPWRGLLVDTSRHFHPLWSLKHIIDALAMAKFNVLHWHLTDAESFPLKLQKHPELAEKGAWAEGYKYSADDVKEITLYGQERGIRVVPEIDTPGHTYSWGKSHPELVVNCSKYIAKTKTYPNINSVCFDMTQDSLYPVLRDVMTEASSMFADDYMHIGGDEVQTGCLDEVPAIKEWMLAHVMNDSSYTDLLRYFRYNISSYVTEANKKMVVWQEAFQEMYGQPQNPLLPTNTIVQVWLNGHWQEAMKDIVSTGFKVLLSPGWYLDQQIPSPEGETHYFYFDTWQDFYSMEPTAAGNLTADEEARIMGGEACQWGESANPYSIDGNVWARAAATAERLWSPKEANDINEAYFRLLRFQCSILQRGIRTSPFRPNHCPSLILDAMLNPPPVGSTVTLPIWVLVIGCIAIVVLATTTIGFFLRLRSRRVEVL